MSDALMPRSRTAILAVLLLHPDRSFYLRELAREAGISAPAAKAEADRLAVSGIVNSVRSGNRVYYSANKNCPVYPELHGLLVKTAGIAEPIKKALEPLAHKLSLAYIYGSFADGSAATKSDVDVMIVGNIEPAAVNDALSAAEAAVGREINASVYSLDEYRRKLALGRGFIYQVHIGKRIDLIGEADDA